MKTNKNNVRSEFSERLMKVIGLKKKVWWERQLGLSNSIISSRWAKGHSPRLETIIEICKLSGVSANWLLLGVGSTYLEDPSLKTELEKEKTIVETQDYINRLEEKELEFDKFTEEIAASESLIDFVVKVSALLGSNKKVSLSIEEVKKLPEEKLFEYYIVPLAVFVKSFGDISFKLIEAMVQTKEARGFIIKMLELIKNEHNKNLFHFKGRLAELDPFIESFQDLISSDRDAFNDHAL